MSEQPDRSAALVPPEKAAATVPQWVFSLLGLWLRRAYHFELEGEENLPEAGPMLLLPTDVQGFLGPLVQMLGLPPVMNRLAKNPNLRQVSIMHEQLYAMATKYIASTQFPMYPVRSHSAGTQALSLIDAYRALNEGGLVNINPEGDESWDGAGVEIRQGGAWLALRSAAPCVLVVPTAGLYDIWPFWGRFPSLKGRVRLRYSEPFRVVDTPLERVTDEDLARAKGMIGAKLEELRFDVGGRAQWAPPPRLNGVELAEVPQLRRDVPVRLERVRRVPAKKMGMATLLFQCPICGTTDSIVHKHGFGRRASAACRACGARWRIKREYGQDFRLTLVHGPQDLFGFDVALSDLHAYVKRNMSLTVSPYLADSRSEVDGQLLLASPKCKLTPYDSSVLTQDSMHGEAPSVRTDDHAAVPTSTALGVGELVLTDRGLFWRNETHDVWFSLSKVTSLHLLAKNTFVMRYGSALYTLWLGSENAVKWIAYLDALINGDGRPVGDKPIRRVPVSPY